MEKSLVSPLARGASIYSESRVWAQKMQSLLVKTGFKPAFADWVPNYGSGSGAWLGIDGSWGCR